MYPLKDRSNINCVTSLLAQVPFVLFNELFFLLCFLSTFPTAKVFEKNKKNKKTLIFISFLFFPQKKFISFKLVGQQI